jgi:drug/metabolite transporter (DMT)-like permease
MTSADAKPPPAAIALAFAVIYISWGTTYFAIKLGMQREQLPPALFGGARFLAAGLLVLAWQGVRGQALRVAPPDLLKMLAAGGLLFVGGSGFINAGLKYLDSSLAAVLVATTPLWIGLFAMLWPQGERVTPGGWLGLFCGLAGVVLLLEPRLRQSADFDLRGVCFVLASAASWSLGSLLLRKLRLDLPHLTAAGYQMFLGGAALAALGLIIGEASQGPGQLTANVVAVFLYLLLVGSLMGFIAFNWLLGHVSAAKVGTYAYINPIVAILIGWFVEEEVTARTWTAIGVILLGVFLVRSGERAPPVAAPDESPLAT